MFDQLRSKLTQAARGFSLSSQDRDDLQTGRQIRQTFEKDQTFLKEIGSYVQNSYNSIPAGDVFKDFSDHETTQGYLGIISGQYEKLTAQASTHQGINTHDQDELVENVMEYQNHVQEYPLKLAEEALKLRPSAPQPEQK
ncbi:MAG: hypothetical protein K9G62_02515 [Alphaproteobacteria bacterium]|nr:hypothetical protein [Alphaproteobacteria bacterium]